VDIEFSMPTSNGLLANQPIAQSDEVLNASLQGCEKMTVCGSIRQKDQIVYTIRDNQLRKGEAVTGPYPPYPPLYTLALKKTADSPH
jgi:hypothetical protein